ncbi:uncharacterized protein [Montipora foliosa]|uniref:uncharacterized protein isoform X3 n=1 Tax=Montipora foliosa TaxID=591990 RepID=UPI0035F1DF25
MALEQVVLIFSDIQHSSFFQKKWAAVLTRSQYFCKVDLGAVKRIHIGVELWKDMMNHSVLSPSSSYSYDHFPALRRRTDYRLRFKSWSSEERKTGEREKVLLSPRYLL